MDKLDLDIIISLKVDSDDRINNLDIVMNYLQNNLRCNIIISEQDTFPKLKDRYDCDYVFTEADEFFNRQRGLNIGVTKSNAKVIAHYDADIIINIKQLLKSYQLINSDNYDMIYPYDGRFLDVPKEYHDMIDKLELIPTDKCNLFNSNSVGGVVFFNRQVFLNGGLCLVASSGHSQFWVAPSSNRTGMTSFFVSMAVCTSSCTEVLRREFEESRTTTAPARASSAFILSDQDSPVTMPAVSKNTESPASAKRLAISVAAASSLRA